MTRECVFAIVAYATAVMREGQSPEGSSIFIATLFSATMASLLTPFFHCERKKKNGIFFIYFFYLFAFCFTGVYIGNVYSYIHGECKDVLN